MRMRLRVLPALGVLLAAASGTAALAQPQTYDVKSLDFDLWCQEVQRWPVARCDARSEQDWEVFLVYRAAVERYEIQYLKDRRDDAELKKRMLDRDYSERPGNPDIP